MFALLVFICALAAHMRTLPYTNTLVDVQEAISIASFIALMWLAVFMSLDGVSSAGRQVISVLIVMINGCYIAFVAWLVVHATKTHPQPENPITAENEAHGAETDIEVNPITANEEARGTEAETQINNHSVPFQAEYEAGKAEGFDVVRV